MREREEEEGKERRGTREKKKEHEERCTEKNGTRKEEARYRIYFVSERWFAAYPAAQKNRASSSSTIKSTGAGGRGGGGELREPWVFRYGRRLQKVVRHEGKELHATLACRNFSRSERWGGGGGGEEKGCTPRRISIPGWNKYPKKVPSGILCVHRLIDSTNPITDCEIAKCVFFVFEIETVYRDRDSGFE